MCIHLLVTVKIAIASQFKQPQLNVAVEILISLIEDGHLTLSTVAIDSAVRPVRHRHRHKPKVVGPWDAALGDFHRGMPQHVLSLVVGSQPHRPSAVFLRLEAKRSRRFTVLTDIDRRAANTRTHFVAKSGKQEHFMVVFLTMIAECSTHLLRVASLVVARERNPRQLDILDRMDRQRHFSVGIDISLHVPDGWVDMCLPFFVHGPLADRHEAMGTLLKASHHKLA